MSVHDSGWPTSLIFCENDRYFSISSCYLFNIYVAYVLCRVHPNARDEVKDKTCEDVPVTGPTSALLISNRHIQVACIVLEGPSCLTNPSQHALWTMSFVAYVSHRTTMSTMCSFGLCQWLVNYVDFVDGLWIMWTMWTLWTIVVYELCGLDVLCYVGHLWTCHPCWASMNCYMPCICLTCTYVLRSVEEMEKIVSRPIAPASVARQPSWNTVQMVVAPSKVEWQAYHAGVDGATRLTR